MSLIESIEKIAETKSFRITAFENGNEKFKCVIPGSKLFDVDDDDITFFDSETGLRVIVVLDTNAEIIGNKIILGNDCLIEIIDRNYDTVSYKANFSFKYDGYSNDKFYVEI